MKLSRQIGTANEPLFVFIQNATVSTGAGLAGIVASSVSFTWLRSDQAAVSTGTCTIGTLGTYSVSSFVQAHSSFAIGLYQFSPPNGIYISGSSCAMLLYGAPNMAPLPIEIELTKTNNQLYSSTQTISTALNLATNADKAGYSGSMNASTVTDKSGYGVSSVTAGVNVSSIAGSAAVTTAAGVLATAWDLGRTANLTSTLALTGVSINAVVSSVTLPIAEHAAISDKLLGRNVEAGSDGGRTVSEALYPLRNKVDTSAGIVYKTDDTTSSWAFTVSTQAGNPIVSIDPS